MDSVIIYQKSKVYTMLRYNYDNKIFRHSIHEFIVDNPIATGGESHHNQSIERNKQAASYDSYTTHTNNNELYGMIIDK